MKKELAFFKMEAVADWNGYTRILSNYLLESAVPILFDDLLHKCNYIKGNPNFEKYKIDINKYNYEEYLEKIAATLATKGEYIQSENDQPSQEVHSANPCPEKDFSSYFYLSIKDDIDEDTLKTLQSVALDNHIMVNKIEPKHIKSTYYKFCFAPQNKEQTKPGTHPTHKNVSPSATQQEKVETWNWYYIPDPRISGSLFWKENNAHQAVWTTILKEQMAEFSKLRMLGDQTEDMRDYHCHSYNYIRLMCKIFIHQELPASQKDITHEFLQMLRDYLLRNVPGLPENPAALSMADLLTKCEELYVNNSMYNKNKTNTYYIDFNKGRYACGLLKQMKKIAQAPDSYEETYPHLNCYLANLEYLYTFMLYVYMTEYLLCYSPVSTPHQKEYNLFKSLTHINYTIHFERYISSLKEK